MARYAPLQEDELDLALSIVKCSSLKKHELHKQVHDLAQVYTRSEQSLYLLAIRLFYVLHGKMPENITGDNKWYSASQSLIEFVISRGHDISEKVKEDMSKEKPVVDRDKARSLMSEYYKNNKSWLPAKIKDKRERILDLIQSGTLPEDAFLEALSSK